MRDEMDARLWNAHHDQLSKWMNGAFGAAAARLNGPVAGRLPEQLLATIAAVSLTLLTLGASAA